MGRRATREFQLPTWAWLTVIAALIWLFGFVCGIWLLVLTA